MSFIPPFCPNPDCIMHFLDLQQSMSNHPWYRHFAYYHTKAFGRIPRFRCLSCRQTFSSQTFSIDYYAKRTMPYRPLMQQLISSSNIRSISRHFNVTTETVSNKLARLSRQAIAMHNLLTAELIPREHLVADGFETFTLSKYFPENIHLLVGKHSQFVYFFNQVTMRRKGRMSNMQKQTCRALYRSISFPTRGLEKSFSQLLEVLYTLISRPKNPYPYSLFTDEKLEYARAILRHQGIQTMHKEGRFSHITISSTAHRTLANDLFSVNYMDRELRKDMAAYHRKSVCFGRNLNNAMQRLAVYLCHHNYIKTYRINNRRRSGPVHAEVAGIRREEIRRQWSQVFHTRYFLSRVKVDEFSRKVWLRELSTPFKRNVEYVPAYVMM